MINILPEKEKNELKHEYITRMLSLCFIMAGILGAVAFLLLIPSYQYSLSKETFADQKLQEFNNQNPEMNLAQLNKSIRDMNAKLQTLITKKPKYIASESAVEKLLAVRTSGVSYKQIMYSENNAGIAAMQVTGVARNRDSYDAFRKAVLAETSFVNPDLPNSNLIKKTDIDFTISFTLK